MISNEEILKLHKMLTEDNIPHHFDDDFFENGIEAYNIIIKRDGQQLCDVIYHYGSYGYNSGLLEIMGGLTLEESENDSVLGYLTAEEVFKRFKYCYENNTSVYVEVKDNVD